MVRISTRTLLLVGLAAAGCARPAASPTRRAPSGAEGVLSARFEAEVVGGTVCRAEHDAWILCQPGSVTVTPRYSQTGRYRVRVRVWQDAAGGEDAAMTIATATATAGPFRVSARRSEPTVVEQVIGATEGVGIVRVSFLNDHYVPDLGQDRNLYIDWIEIEGPIAAPRVVVAESG